jgi:hypothetical protein
MDDDREDENGQIELKSKDGKSFIIPEKAAKVSVLLNDMPREEDSDITSIDIARVNSDCLEKVVDFMKHYAEEEMKEIPTPLGGSSFEEVSSSVGDGFEVFWAAALWLIKRFFLFGTGDGSTMVPEFRFGREPVPRYAFRFADRCKLHGHQAFARPYLSKGYLPDHGKER